MALLSQARSLFSSRSGRISAGALLEVVAYHLTLHGRFYLRRDDFRLALDRLVIARTILAELAKGTTTSRDHSLYMLFSDEIAPQIRFAAHSQGHKAAYNIEAVVKEVNTSKLRDTLVPGYEEIVLQLRGEGTKEAASSGSLGRAMLREPLWEGKPVPIRNPELVDAFIKVQNAEDAMVGGKRACTPPKKAGATAALPPGGKSRASAASKTTRSRVAAFDDVLLALADAQQVAHKLVESQKVTLDVLALHTQTPT